MEITRKQLKEFGASDYLVKRLTNAIQAVGKQGRAHLYSINQVLEAISELLEAPKTRKTTKAVLKQLEVKVNGLLVPGTVDDRLREMMRSVGEANAQFEQTARDAREASEELRTHRRKKGSFLPKNDIVMFSGCS